jgi:hypothetical protein
MESVGVSLLRTTSIHFVEPGVKVNGRYYREVLPKQKLLPDVHQMSEFNVFKKTVRPTNRTREKVDLLMRETPDLIPPTFWPPNSPDLNPVDYKLWSIMQEKVYRERIKDVNELRSRILTAWNEVDHCFIDTAVSRDCNPGPVFQSRNSGLAYSGSRDPGAHVSFYTYSF